MDILYIFVLIVYSQYILYTIYIYIYIIYCNDTKNYSFYLD
uniref:Uncharacterized protein n=1 Tax=viral metagenome TaxID=1070528 RepID=A0A6C0E2W6_9ZZZZ